MSGPHLWVRSESAQQLEEWVELDGRFDLPVQQLHGANRVAIDARIGVIVDLDLAA